MIKIKSHSKTVTQESSEPFIVEVSCLPVIRCRCGAEILLVPDVKAMGKAIDSHVECCPITKQSENFTECVADLSEYLIGQVLDLAVRADSIERKH